MFHIADMEWIRVCNKKQKCLYIKFSQKLFGCIYFAMRRIAMRLYKYIYSQSYIFFEMTKDI